MEISVEKLDFSNIDERLKHISNDSIVELIKKYYDGIKVSDLLEEYKINTNPSQLYTLFPPLKLENKCKICNSQSIYYFESKTSCSYSYSSFFDKLNTTNIECEACGHKENRFCNCEFCISERNRIREEEEEKRKKFLAKKKEIIDRVYSEDRWKKVSEIDLGLEDRLYLVVIMRSSLSEDGTYIEALKEKMDILAPTDKFRESIVNTLSEKYILIPHINSNLESFELSEEDGLSYYIYRVNYRINIEPADNNYEAMIKRLMYPDSNIFEDDKDFCFQMWKKIALQECLEYLLYRMDKVGYSFNPGEKTINVIEHLLESFSVAQIYNIVYRAIAYSTTRYQAGEITKLHAQNSVISSCEKQGERAIAEKWNLKHYDRIKDLPQTLISEIFFTSILKISELGFIEKPTRNV